MAAPRHQWYRAGDWSNADDCGYVYVCGQCGASRNAGQLSPGGRCEYLGPWHVKHAGTAQRFATHAEAHAAAWEINLATDGRCDHTPTADPYHVPACTPAGGRA